MSLTPTPARTPHLDTGSPEEKREEIRRYFHDTFDVYEKLFEVMASDEAYFRRADPLRHPLIFYLGHTAVFYINKLVLAKVIDQRIEPKFESIFAIGVDEMSWDDLDQSNYDWPPLDAVFKYRRKVRALIDDLIETMPLDLPITWDKPFWVVMMGIEHERIHLETSSVLIRQLPLDLLQEHQDWPVCPRSGPAPLNEMRDVPGGSVHMGKAPNHGLYGWDNEYGELALEVSDFQASQYLISNGEFKDFVTAGGYSDSRWWTDEGWAWVQYQKAEHPRFWLTDHQGHWKLRCMVQEIPMPWDWPVEVNQLEAKAYCNWVATETGKPVRLPTEEEWYRVLDVAGLAEQPDWSLEPGNINLALHASSCPVTDHVTGGFGDVMGNVWQHTETPISGLPGFRVHPFYDDFSTPTFDTQHNLIKGGSWISTGNEATRDSRYAFRRHFYQHAGFRTVISDTAVTMRNDVYETDDLVAQYCAFHYGDEYFGVPNYPRQLAEICTEIMQGKTVERALDLGCATGRATLELARTFDHVTGIDFSARFIRVGHELQNQGYTRYAIQDEGELVSYHEARLDEMGLDDVRNKVEFWQGDAHNLKAQFTSYDLILAANLVDRLYEPGAWLSRVHERLKPGGVLVLTSPYTWLEEFTPRDKWLGGLKVDGENVTTLDGLHAVLKEQFTPLGEPRDVPFVIRETARKFQHTVAQLTAWQRR